MTAPYVDIRLRAPDEAAMLADLHRFAGWLTIDDGRGRPTGWRRGAEGFAFSPIGQVVNREAVLAPDKAVITPARLDTRFHANLRLWGARLALAPLFSGVKPGGTEAVVPRSPSGGFTPWQIS